ncbi:MAG: hypothetical protein ACYS9Y_11385 [Planctomycetota bacterium]|jgi:hypothetical protein
MDSQFRNQIEKGTRIAFTHYIVRHSNVVDRLQGDCSEVISSTIKIIKNDPKIIAAIKDMPEDTVLERIIEVAQKCLPKVTSSLESGCKLIHKEK